MKRVVLGVVVCLLQVSLMGASGHTASEVRANAARAAQVVIGTVVDVQSRFDRNEHGDQVIVSDLQVTITETMKGRPQGSARITVEGGTVGDITMRASDMPPLRRGDRGVFFLDPDAAGDFKPHGRGRGIARFDSAQRVLDSDLTVADIRRLVRAATR